MKDFILKALRKTTSDKLYYQCRYLFKHGELLNLNHPTTFNAKLIWLNLYDRKPEYAYFVDKYTAREYIRRRIGEQYLNDLYGVYDRVDAIDFSKLPDSFVLKATHGSGWVIVCNDKSKLDVEAARREMNSWLNQNFYDLYGEWVYKDLKPRIICEKFLHNKNESGLTDYKFYCFHGIPRFVQVDMDRGTNHTRTYFDLFWKRIHFELGGCPARDEEIPCPETFDEMLRIVRILCHGFKFIRVDLYEVEGQLIFGELTLFSGNGMLNFSPKSFDTKIGSCLKIEETETLEEQAVRVCNSIYKKSDTK
ncbi:ATP-grasp fold amidoligase family protein [Mangrovibacterium sp.]|uniref:ATP-grasp fold amidoligase family protein n=1 Tax=Mangrovibacterium sp. TaxID=1961364 RepID=UPI00356418A7